MPARASGGHAFTSAWPTHPENLTSPADDVGDAPPQVQEVVPQSRTGKKQDDKISPGSGQGGLFCVWRLLQTFGRL
jgi:hypothetical protein